MVGRRCGVAAAYALRSVPPPTAVGSENTKKRTRHTAVDGDAKPPETAAGAGAGAGANSCCWLLVYGSPLATFSVERSRRTANALYQRTVIAMTEPTRGDEDAEQFTIFTRREESGGTGGGDGDDGFSLYVSLGFFVRTERGDD